VSAFPFAQLDVFGARAGDGNPLAVVFDADRLDGVAMQRFAAWTNLSETAFLLAPVDKRADLRVRIFTPRRELPFAGHPAVGSVWAALDARSDGVARTALALECGAGVLPVRVEGTGAGRRVFVQAPPAAIAPAGVDAASLAAALGQAPERDPPPCIVDNGPRWLLARLADAAAVRALRPDLAAVAALTQRIGAVGVCVFGREAEGDCAFAVRAFCPADGIPEDPVTGSANAAIGALLHARGALAGIGPRWRASQGREVGRDGIVEVEVDPARGTVAIGGRCTACIRGSAEFGDPA
jgi:PhzF family phenazine biosynthesis protein